MTPRPPLVLVPQSFGSLVFDRRTSRYLPFDAVTTALLREAVDRPVFDVGSDDDGRVLFEALEARGFFTLDGRLAAEVLDGVPPADHLAGPLAVHVEVIAACDLACAHCFAGPLPRKGLLALAELDALFAEMAAMGSFRLGLTGGEPLLRRDLFDVMDAATARGLHPCLTTHGLHIDDDIARKLGARELVWLNVSLDGATAETHDAIRGPGTFARVLDHLRILRRHARFTLAFTITSRSAAEVEACGRLARDVGAHTAVFRPLYPVGTAAQHLDLMPTYDAYADALDRLAVSLGPDGEVRAIDPFSPQIRETVQAKTFVGDGCGAATLVASVSASGDVSPCSFLGPGAVAGNVRETSFRDLWHHSRGFTELRRLGCDGCGGFEGGCRARAQTFGGHLDAADPWYAAWIARKRRHPGANVEVWR